MKYITMNYLPDRVKVLFVSECALDKRVCSAMIELGLATRPNYYERGEAEVIMSNHQVEYSIAGLQSQALATLNYKKYLFPTNLLTKGV